jgi:type I restriction enzyme S subunit
MSILDPGGHYPINLRRLPSTWICTYVGDAIDEIQPGFASGVHNDRGEGVAHLRPMNIDRLGRVDLTRLKYVPDSGGLRLLDGDVLFNNTNSPELVGKTTAIRGEKEWAFSNHMTRLRPPSGIAAQFLAFQLHYLWMTGYFRYRCTHHVNQASIASKTLAASVPLILAPFEEQLRIVAEIEKQFTRLDDAVAGLKRVQANLKRYRASVLKAACEGRLVPTEAEVARKEGRSYETGEQLLARILKERRAKWEAEGESRCAEPLAPPRTGLSELPKGWTWATFDQLIAFGPQNGLYKPASAYGRGLPIVRIEDYQDDWSNERDRLKQLTVDDNEAATYGLLPSDVLINRVNSPSHLGKCMIVAAALCPAVFESNMMRIRFAVGVEPYWVATTLREASGRARLTSNAKWAVNQASINQGDVRLTPVPLPPLNEQTRASAEVERRLTLATKLLSQMERHARYAERLRSGILAAAFSGRLVPQDPKDEPASVLLGRIRAERAAAAPRPARRAARARR